MENIAELLYGPPEGLHHLIRNLPFLPKPPGLFHNAPGDWIIILLPAGAIPPGGQDAEPFGVHHPVVPNQVVHDAFTDSFPGRLRQLGGIEVTGIYALYVFHEKRVHGQSRPLLLQHLIDTRHLQQGMLRQQPGLLGLPGRKPRKQVQLQNHGKRLRLQRDQKDPPIESAAQPPDVPGRNPITLQHSFPNRILHTRTSISVSEPAPARLPFPWQSPVSVPKPHVCLYGSIIFLIWEGGNRCFGGTS